MEEQSTIAITLPIIRHNDYNKKSKKTKLKIYNAWIMSNLEYADDFDGESISNNSDSDEEDCSIVYRDSNDYRLGGLFTISKNNIRVMYIINRGYVMIKYVFPNDKLPFNSSMVRWWNLFYCGGFRIIGPKDEIYSSCDYLADDMIAKLKPIGFIMCKKKNLKKTLKKLTVQHLLTNVSKVNTLFGYEIAVCQNTTFGEAFDVKAFIKSYEIMQLRADCKVFTKSDKKYFKSLKNIPLSHWLADWDYANPKTNRELMLTGLLLGYPIESTFDRMCYV